MPEVFICYSHKDQRAREELEEHLGNFSDLGLVAWSDQRIQAGEAWLEEIEAALGRADAAILLVSRNFLNSRFITEVEVPALLEARDKSGAPVFPLLVRDCNWSVHPWLAAMQVRPRGNRALMRSRPADRDTILTAFTHEVAERTGALPGKSALTPGSAAIGAEISLPADLDSDNESLIAEIEAFLRRETGSKDLTIVMKKKGSLRLFVRLQPEALARLKASLADGALLSIPMEVEKEGIALDVHEMRGKRVLLDETLSVFFDTKVKAINQARQRNEARFDESYAFQMTDEEWRSLKSQFVTAKTRGGRRTPPWVYTEPGAAMLATLLRTPQAVEASKLIIETFVAARRSSPHVPPANDDGLGDPELSNAAKRDFKSRLKSFDPPKDGQP